VTDATGIPATIIDAKGDLIAGTASDTAARLAVGSTGQVLTATPAAATGLSWATPTTPGLQLIASTTLTDTQAAITFANIPQTFKGLKILLCGASNTSAVFTDVLALRINGDTGSNYQYQRLSATATTVSGSEFNTQTLIDCGTIKAAAGTDNYGSQFDISMFGYASGFFKTALSFSTENYRSGDSHLALRGGAWKNIAAVTEVSLFPTSGSFIAGTVCCLYGVV
jgi:hypothetical protein